MAVADPKLYRSDIYRVVAFCKVAVILHQLRQRLGDERFFRAWKAAFTTLRGRKIDFDDFEKALASAAKTDLRPYFDQWFFQAGHPRLKVTWRSESLANETVLWLDVEQLQPRGLYTLRVPIAVDHGGGRQTRLHIDVTQRRQELRMPVPASAEEVRADPDWTLPLLESEVVRQS